eukprot:CAMPEP_0178401090 /NCGR_PEP_ID=MMETSP0689_2-20121128/16123_1 /TAXON_ID=160604 /ORGANISM="Amphidinium massartii, Strain CS-259" /LENGTH=714 /DNA_ID=CAMNT_0020021901 /DNA_START=1 /DNA_END=2146 /DNA_ORIENTATION=-
MGRVSERTRAQSQQQQEEQPQQQQEEEEQVQHSAARVLPPPPPPPPTAPPASVMPRGARPDRAFVPKRVCKYWAAGRCKMAEKCTFLHPGYAAPRIVLPSAPVAVYPQAEVRPQVPLVVPPPHVHGMCWVAADHAMNGMQTQDEQPDEPPAPGTEESTPLDARALEALSLKGAVAAAFPAEAADQDEPDAPGLDEAPAADTQELQCAPPPSSADAKEAAATEGADDLAARLPQTPPPQQVQKQQERAQQSPQATQRAPAAPPQCVKVEDEVLLPSTPSQLEATLAAAAVAVEAPVDGGQTLRSPSSSGAVTSSPGKREDPCSMRDSSEFEEQGGGEIDWYRKGGSEADVHEVDFDADEEQDDDDGDEEEQSLSSEPCTLEEAEDNTGGHCTGETLDGQSSMPLKEGVSQEACKSPCNKVKKADLEQQEEDLQQQEEDGEIKDARPPEAEENGRVPLHGSHAMVDGAAGADEKKRKRSVFSFEEGAEEGAKEATRQGEESGEESSDGMIEESEEDKNEEAAASLQLPSTPAPGRQLRDAHSASEDCKETPPKHKESLRNQVRRIPEEARKPLISAATEVAEKLLQEGGPDWQTAEAVGKSMCSEVPLLAACMDEFVCKGLPQWRSDEVLLRTLFADMMDEGTVLERRSKGILQFRAVLPQKQRQAQKEATPAEDGDAQRRGAVECTEAAGMKLLATIAVAVAVAGGGDSLQMLLC